MVQQEPRATDGMLAVDHLTVSLLVDHLNAIYLELAEIRQHMAIQTEKIEVLTKVMEEMLSVWDNLTMTRKFDVFFPKLHGIGSAKVKQTIRGGVEIGPAEGH